MAETNHILCACGCQQVCNPGRTWTTGHGGRSRSRNFEERFWARVEKTARCWLWRGAINASGYGVVGVQGKVLRAHRVAYEMFYGLILPGLYCLHTCDNPPCVRPEHLFVGTPADNMHDMARKGRHKANPKLTAEQVKDIHRLYRQEHWNQSRIATLFGVDPSNISLILRNIIWQHIPDD
jgi:predicted XRE-type DNA-binding protein